MLKSYFIIALIVVLCVIMAVIDGIHKADYSKNRIAKNYVLKTKFE